MKAVASRAGTYRHHLRIRDHRMWSDESVADGGGDAGPSPQELLAASLAACTAVTMEMYAKRKGWDIGDVEVVADYTPAERGCPTRFSVVLRFPPEVPEEQVQKLRQISAKCPIHRTLDGEVMFDERVERLALAH